MPTVSKDVADKIKNGDGYYADDARVMRIVEYTDMGGNLAYGLEYKHQLGTYVESVYIRQPKIYFEAT